MRTGQQQHKQQQRGSQQQQSLGGGSRVPLAERLGAAAKGKPIKELEARLGILSRTSPEKSSPIVKNLENKRTTRIQPPQAYLPGLEFEPIGVSASPAFSETSFKSGNGTVSDSEASDLFVVTTDLSVSGG